MKWPLPLAVTSRSPSKSSSRQPALFGRAGRLQSRCSMSQRTNVPVSWPSNMPQAMFFVGDWKPAPPAGDASARAPRAAATSWIVRRMSEPPVALAREEEAVTGAAIRAGHALGVAGAGEAPRAAGLAVGENGAGLVDRRVA